MPKMVATMLLALACGGLISAAAARTASAQGPAVLFDEAHKQQFLIEGDRDLDLSALAGAFARQGFRVAPGHGPLTEESLSGVDALVISGAFASLEPAELAAVTRFVENGGRLCVMLHIPFPLIDLLQRLGVAFSNGVIHEREHVIAGDDVSFRVNTGLSEHPLLKDIDGFNLYGGWALVNTGSNAQVLARTGPRAWVDLDGNKILSHGDAVQAFGVIVAGQLGRGSFVVFGDDAIFQNRFLTEDNAALAEHLVRWLSPAPTI